jgi:hypothetical protein
MKIRVVRVLRLAFLSKTALATLLVTSYVTVLGLTGLVTGYFADSLSTRFSRPPYKNFARAESRVEKWLKMQTVSYTALDSRVDLTGANSAEPSALLTKPSIPVRQVPHAAALAAAMDASEHPGLQADGTSQTVERITKSVNRRTVSVVTASVAMCESGSCDAGAAPQRSKAALKVAKVRKAGKPVQLAAHNKIKRSRSGNQVASLKSQSFAHGKMALGVKPPVRSRLTWQSWKNIHLADSPAEIIRRSLRGTT